MQLTWVSLLPPLLVICAVFFTHHLNISLALGIVCAALIATHFNVMSAVLLCVEKFTTHLADSDTLYLYCVLIIISSLITLLTVTGSAIGCARIIGQKMRTRRSVEISTVMLSFLLSIDDYLSILTVGFVMRPIADRLMVARTKLAYIVHALGGPLVIIMPISTWAAAILSQLDNAGISLNPPHKIVADSFYVYLKTIPFIFYSIFVVFSVLFVVITRIGYGAIARDELEALALEKEIVNDPSVLDEKHSIIELVMPIGILVFGVILGTLYVGNYHLFGGNNSFFQAFRENHKTFFIFFVSSLTAFICSVLLALYKKMISLRQIPVVVHEGAILMGSSIFMVMFASILGSFLRIELQTGNYIAHLLLDIAPIALIPAMLFLVSLMITLTIGSAWGTFSLLIPIATQMLISLLQLEVPVGLDQIPILFPSLGAILSGAACGNHLSPIAETTMMTATTTGIKPLVHAKSQFHYAFPVVIGALAAFVLAGLLCSKSLYESLLVSSGVGMGLTILLLLVLNYRKNKVK